MIDGEELSDSEKGLLKSFKDDFSSYLLTLEAYIIRKRILINLKER